MVLLAFILCGLAAGLACGGSLRAMAQHNIALLWLPVAAYLCKAAGPYAARLFPAFASYAPLAVCLLHYGLLFIFVAANLRRGVWSFVFGAGAGMNFAVIALNGGAMPVSAHVLESAAGTRLAAQLAAGDLCLRACHGQHASCFSGRCSGAGAVRAPAGLCQHRGPGAGSGRGDALLYDAASRKTFGVTAVCTHAVPAGKQSGAENAGGAPAISGPFRSPRYLPVGTAVPCGLTHVLWDVPEQSADCFQRAVLFMNSSIMLQNKRPRCTDSETVRAPGPWRILTQELPHAPFHTHSHIFPTHTPSLYW